MTHPGIDHGLLSPSGRMSKAARKAAMAREAERLFPPGFWDDVRCVPQPTDKEYLLRNATQMRDLAERGIGPRKHMKEALRLEAEAAKLS